MMSKLFERIRKDIAKGTVETMVTQAQLANDNCQTACSPSQPADAPNPFRRDGLLQVYCWALIHGPAVPKIETIPRPAHSSQRWTQEAHRQRWDNGVLWACQAIRCITRAQLQGRVGGPLREVMDQIRAAPRADRVKVLNRMCPTGRSRDRALAPLPMRKADSLVRIAEHKLDAARRNEHLWPSQQAFWNGVKAAAQHYSLAWQTEASPSRPDDSMAEWYADGLHDAMFFGARGPI